MPTLIPVTDRIALDPSEIEESFIRAGGPGGQNVNTVSTAAQIRFDVRRSPSLPDPVRHRLERSLASRLSADGVLVITARRFRTQEQNRRDAVERLVALIRGAAEPPKPRIKTRPTLASKQRRLTAKSRRAAVKGGRSPPGLDD